jgi:hypothetical protein
LGIATRAAACDGDNSRCTLPPLKPVFVPKFKGAAEMDECRRLRLQAQRGATAVDVMSPGGEAGDEVKEEEEDSFLQVEDEDFDVVDVGVSVDINGDEFDPCVLTLFDFLFPKPPYNCPFLFTYAQMC